MRKIIYLFLIAIATISCNKNKIYESHFTDIPKYRWEQTNVAEFEPEITHNHQDYKLIVALRYVYGFQFSKVRVKVEIISPSGGQRSKLYDLPFFDKQNKPLSDCAGDYCDLETTIAENFRFKETGRYKIRISQQMNFDPLPNMMGVGFIIEKMDEEK